MESLYRINTELAVLLMKLEQNGGELTEEIETRLDDIEGAREEKINWILAAYRNYIALEASAKAEAEHFTAIKKRAAESQKSIEKYLLKNLGNDFKQETKFGKLSFRASEYVDIPDETKIASAYTVIKIAESPDKEAIKQAIKAGEKVTGASIKNRFSMQLK